ncbi:MFS transporter [bacterium]|nr:MFS transporter [bacterium]
MKSKPLAVLFITILIDLLGFGIIIPILPIYAKELGATDAMVSVVGFIFPLMQFLFSPFLGSVSDRFGRKPIILGSLLVNVLGYSLFANAISIPLLFAARLLNGIGSANLGAAQAYISDVTEPENRAKSFGIIGAAFGLGFIFGPPLGGVIKQFYGIEAVGYTLVALCVVNLLVVYFFLPESLKDKSFANKLRINPLGGLNLAFTQQKLRSLISMNFIFIIAFALMQLASALLWAEKYKLSELEISYVFMYIGFVSALFQGGVVGIVSKKIGEERMLVLGSISMGLGLAILATPSPAWFVPVELLSMTLIAFGNSMLMPATTSLVSKYSDKKSQGIMLGINQSIGSLGRAVGFLLSGSLYGIIFFLPFATGAVMMVAVMFLALAFNRKK